MGCRHSVHVQLQPYYVHVCLLTKGQEIMFLGFDVGDELVACHQNFSGSVPVAWTVNDTGLPETVFFNSCG